MKKRKIAVWAIMLIFTVLYFNFSDNSVNIKAAAKPDARIVDYDSDSRTERFHYGRNIGESVNVTVIGDRDNINVTNVQFTSSDRSVCSVQREDDYYEINFLKEGTAVITMTCRADDEPVEKRLLASCLTSISSVEGKIKANSTAYRGCSDKEGISSKTTEVKDKITVSTDISIDGICKEYFRVWLKEGNFGDSGENWAYVKKQDVEIPLKDITVPETMNMYEGEEKDMDIQYVPSIATSHEVLWKSSNTNVVKVDENGKLSAGTIGSAVITVSCKNNEKIIKKCRVTVKPYIKVTGIKITPNDLNIDDGEEGKFNVEVFPEEASNKKYKIKVGNESIIDVDEKGEFMAITPGKTTVTVISEDGGYEDTCNVNVKFVEATGVWIQPTMIMAIGEVTQCNWNMIPTTASNQSVKWKSSNTKAVTVDKAGNCIAKSEGIAKIQIITDDGFTSYCTVMVKDYVEDISLEENDIKLSLGKSKTLKCNIYPKEATNKKLIWKSNNGNIVSVTNKGKIKALKTGEAEIFVYERNGGAYDFCFVEVKADLNTPKLTVKKKKKNYTLSWKKIKYATSYVLYQYNKKTKKYKKLKTLNSKTLKKKLGKAKKNSKYRLKAYYKPNDEYSVFSNVIKIK